ncbi:MAG: hypothetical protein BroJett011_07590 [Chloroflexota bacterium]|nr:MAG: hypothetical protein BroJett011_07590 [Chloroflexota bacterium]
MILEQVQQLLANGKYMSIPDLAGRIPELYGREEAEEILYLLLRLDKRFDNTGELWFTTVARVDPVEKIISATEAYFDTHNPRGELVEHLVEAIARETGEQQDTVQEIILRSFRSVQNGRVILNQRVRA